MKEVTTGRRSFLKSTTAAVVGAVVVRPESVFGTPANSAPELGIIGCGGRGKYVGRFFDELTNARIVALSDPFEDRLQDTKSQFQKDNPRSYQGLESYEELIQSDVDAVVVATPCDLHSKMAVAALAAGKHIYCEKPLTHNVSEARILAKAAKEAGAEPDSASAASTPTGAGAAASTVGPQ